MGGDEKIRSLIARYSSLSYEFVCKTPRNPALCGVFSWCLRSWLADHVFFLTSHLDGRGSNNVSALTLSPPRNVPIRLLAYPLLSAADDYIPCEKVCADCL